MDDLQELGSYLKKVVDSFNQDNDITKALRRLHIKEVHLKRKGNAKGVKVLKRVRRLI